MFLVRFRYHHCCVSVIMRPLDYFISPNLALGKLWDRDPWYTLLNKCTTLNTLVSARIRGFSKKKRLNAFGFAREFLWSDMLYWPGKSLKRRGKSFSLHSKKNFLLGGCGFFVSDVISGGLLGHLGPLRLAPAPTVRW